MDKIKDAPWTGGQWTPEKNSPTFSEEAQVFQMAILQYSVGGTDHGSIPAIAFGRTAEECMANAWLLAASKDLFTVLNKITSLNPTRRTPEEWLTLGGYFAESMDALHKAIRPFNLHGKWIKKED